ncbi:Amidinotransferase [Trichostrongylus colubriformis]|uniref:Amidinotransferase n=1 Tax=Trichostrongylus colubriformis TaxID=6319 RepID=A0AAN8EMD8_TRICO
MSIIRKATCRILMCRPTYFQVFYSINPWMAMKDPVDHQKAMDQWNTLKKTIEKCGAEVEVMEPTKSAENVPDLVFTANAAIVRGKRVYLASFAHEQRKEEWKFNDKWFRENGYRTYHNPDIPHEGAGDALWCRNGEVLIAGVGPRSDVRALTHIQENLQTEDDPFKILGVRLVDERFYHLDTCFCPLDDKLALWYPHAFDPVCQHNLGNYFELLPVHESEAEQFACNAVVIGKNVIMNEGSERIAKLLELYGFKTHFVEMSEFLKSGGSAKCLTLQLD